MKILSFILSILFISSSLIKGQNKAENMIIITLDGFRWNEVFSGADPDVLDIEHTKWENNRSATCFWDESPEVRRKLLMPFLWTEVVSKGSLYGNRHLGCKVNVANRYWFSYPGYHEMLTGNPRAAINSNSLGPNPDITVLEQINQLPEFDGKVAVFSSWNVFSDIINERRSRIFVNSAFTSIPDHVITPMQSDIEIIYDLIPKTIGNVRYDGLTFMQAFEYLKTQRPRVLMIALDETDEFGHMGNYVQYLQSAHRTDRLIEKLWTWIQSDSSYRDNTSLVITTDHGRGEGKGWRRHGLLTPHSNETWIAVMSPDIEPLGMISKQGMYYNAQIAETISSLLEVPFDGNDPRYISIIGPVNNPIDLLTSKINDEK
jgi:hypothetical protein